MERALKLFLYTDILFSGHGTVGREFIKHLLPFEEVQLNVSTHQVGFNLKGFYLNYNKRFPDLRMRENLFKSGRINPDYLLEKKRDFRDRPHSLYDQPYANRHAKSNDLMIRDFEDIENVGMSIGGLEVASQLESEAYRIAETCYNLSQAKSRWKIDQQYADEIWVPNKWNRQVLLKGGIDEDKIILLPYGIDFIRPTYNAKVDKLNDDKFNFLSVGRWCVLKGMDLLIQAYLEEFLGEEPVRLFIKTTLNQQAPLSGQRVVQMIQAMVNEMNIPDVPEIGVATEPWDQQTLWDIYGSADAFVLPSRAEGVGRAPYECLGIEKPLITTNWSAFPEHLEGNPAWFPVEINGLVKPKHESKYVYYWRQEYQGNDLRWADPSVESLRAQMRKVYELSKDNPEKLSRDCEKGATLIREQFDWHRLIKDRVARLMEVA